MNEYIGHPMQLYGVKSVKIDGGRGDGMRLLQVNNGSGLNFTISVDRCGDISELSYKGTNYAYIAPAGYVAPQYFDNKGAGFLKSFTAGFMTTCGLTNAGSPNTDDGEELNLHGTVSHIPCENVNHTIENGRIIIKTVVRDAALFNHQLLLEREYICPLFGNSLTMTDTITNIGSKTSPIEVLYHCNMGYPLLSEHSVLDIPAINVIPRNAHASTGLSDCLKAETPQKNYEEMCFYHEMEGDVCVSLYNPQIDKGIRMSYNANELGFFTEWKMMGEHEYVIGLEPGNCNPDGRHAMRELGKLEFLKPREKKIHHLKFEFTEEN